VVAALALSGVDELGDRVVDGAGRQHGDHDGHHKAERSQRQELATAEVRERGEYRDRCEHRRLAHGAERGGDQQADSEGIEDPLPALLRSQHSHDRDRQGHGKHAHGFQAHLCRSDDASPPEAVDPALCAGGAVELEPGREQPRSPVVERVRREPILPDDADRNDDGEHERVGHKGADLGPPHRARNDHEERDVRDQQRKLFQREIELEGLVEIARVEDHA
jgi:hypothetical protein